MSEFDDLMAAVGAPLLLEQNGRSVTYNVADGTDTPITAGVGDVRTDEEPNENGIDMRDVRNVAISTDPASASGGIAAPAINDAITIDGVEWQVVSIASRSANMATLVVALPAAREMSKPGYRGRS